MKALNYLLSIKDSMPKGHTYDAELDEAIAELKELDQYSHKYTRVEVISFDGRIFCDRCKNGSYYEASIQDDGRTLKLFLKKTSSK